MVKNRIILNNKENYNFNNRIYKNHNKDIKNNKNKDNNAVK
jgi:hypothetical protein